ncbi:response regulator transcription factor [Winogradskyella flava]|uniref:Response regulator transcription factor n=1 Tax=Winogradskyella flava TaxID=1884876 RepID=A0A842IPL9_9FLAO|nr:response regulator transcription factor [Winogradskyella flava]MBC2843763.1 response regulator transcription factor [Winogradskyella flava]
MINILLIEDDKSFGYVLSEYMKLKNYNVVWKETASEAISAIQSASKFDLAILDVNLKQSTGYNVAKLIKEDNIELPFIFLTARDLKIDQLKGYQLGAEEYITKPIDEEILLAKIESILARNNNKSIHESELVWKDVTLNTNKRELKVKNTITQLTERESLLIKMLLSNPERLVERNNILKELWENQDEFSRNSMDVYISRLRKYLSESDINIRNIHGKGFVLE